MEVMKEDTCMPTMVSYAENEQACFPLPTTTVIQNGHWETMFG